MPLLYLLGCAGIVSAWAGTTMYRVAEGDTIRSILLHATCVASMNEYSGLRAEFARLNPKIFHSGMLATGQEVLLPRGEHRKGCAQIRLGQVVRVEFEPGATSEKVLIYLDGPLLPDLFLLKNQSPHRLVCDFDEALPGEDLKRDLVAPGRLVRGLRIGQETAPFRRTRIVLDLEENLVGQVEQIFFEEESLFVLTLHEQF